MGPKYEEAEKLGFRRLLDAIVAKAVEPRSVAATAWSRERMSAVRFAPNAFSNCRCIGITHDDQEERFTALLHHVNPDSLREAFYALKRDAAPRVDGMTASHRFELHIQTMAG